MQKIREKSIFLIYDGVQNSVFSSQVLSPILGDLEQNPNKTITLISFEKDKIEPKTIKKLIKNHRRLRFIIINKKKFEPINFLLKHNQLKNIILELKPNQITCRGPLAGFISIKTLKSCQQHPDFKPPKLIIQARGLCAQESRFAAQFLSKPSLLAKIKNKIAFKFLEFIEKKVFGLKLNYKSKIEIEAVSPALAQYLTKEFKTDPSIISIAQKDIPKYISAKQKEKWRSEIREILNIPTRTTVYCYSGSAKPWQCAKESIEFFEQKYIESKSSFLLILTTETQKFEDIISKSNLPKNSFIILNVKPEDIYKYIAAADIGLLFRHNDIINWVSRPTKMLEYKALGLKIEHNNTVGMLLH